MAAKFYATPSARRPLVFSGKTFTFEIVSISGLGVLKTEDAGDIALLDAAVTARRGVKSISEEEYNDSLEKKKSSGRTSASLNGSKPPPRPVQVPKLLPDLPVEGKGSAASAARPGEVRGPQEITLHKDAKPAVKDLIRIERVNPPQPFARATEKAAKASKRASAKAARLVRQKVL